MDDPSIDVAVKRRAVLRLFALGLGLWTTLLSVGVSADERSALTRLPPVSNGWPPQDAPYAAGSFRSERVSPEHPTDWSYGVGRLPPPDSSIPPERVRELLPSTIADDQLFQLTSLKEPADESQESSKDSKKEAGTADKDKPDQPPTFGRRPESNALQFLRSQDVLLKPGAWQFDTGLAYTHFENSFPVPITDPVTGDMIGVANGLVRRRLLYTPLAVRYGLTKNVQLFATLPMGWSNTQFSTPGVSESTNTGGLGDLTAGASFHLLKSESELPDVIATMDFTAPTGVFSSPIFGLVPGSSLGQGFWAMSGSLLFIHRYDPIIVFYGGGFRHLFERTFDGVLFSAGEQILYQFGVGFSVNDRVTLSTAFQAFYITDTQLDNVTIEGTNLQPMSLRFAATIARNCRILEPFVAIGATESAPAVNCGIVVTFY